MDAQEGKSPGPEIAKAIAAPEKGPAGMGSVRKTAGKQRRPMGHRETSEELRFPADARCRQKVGKWDVIRTEQEGQGR